ncbi:MAG: ComEA family DNA-binding protein [Chloroflexi bacterium]|nr:ComEA family DNA-binding protein [Chloroflexota bacterium]
MQTLVRYRGYLALTLIFAIAFGTYVLYERRPQPEPIVITTPPPTATPTASPLVVHVVGAVRAPGVYALAPGSRVQHAVEAAGGLTEAADTLSINLADYAFDGQQIRVPERGAATSPIPTPGAAASTARSGAITPPGALINVNSATLAELDALPGIGPAYAQRIIDYRTEHGPFTSPEQLRNVSGIGPATYERIAGLITVQ